MSKPSSDVWEAKLPQQWLILFSLAAAMLLIDTLAYGQLAVSGERVPRTPGVLAVSLACSQVAIAAVFMTLGNVGVGRQGLILGAVIAYSGLLVSAGGTIPVRWDAACGELVVLASIVAMPGALARLIGVRLVHRTDINVPRGRRWQFSLVGFLGLTTYAAGFFAALRWMTTSEGSAIGIILEWLAFSLLPWICVALIWLPIPPLLAAGTVWLVSVFAASACMIVASFLGRPSMPLSVAVEGLACGMMLLTLRLAGYELIAPAAFKRSAGDSPS